MTFRDRFFRALRGYGWLVSLIASIVVCVVTVVVIYSRAPAVVGIPLPETVEEVPSTGAQGFPVDVFCEDAATEVTVTVLQDVGESFEALRIKDGVPELVVWNTDETDNRLATYYFMDAGVQQSGVAVVNDAAATCMREKGQ
jgi:hypothetical protein